MNVVIDSKGFRITLVLLAFIGVCTVLYAIGRIWDAFWLAYGKGKDAEERASRASDRAFEAEVRLEQTKEKNRELMGEVSRLQAELLELRHGSYRGENS